jgi:hypothetical protein
VRLDYVLALLQLEGAGDIPLSEISENIARHRWWIFFYLLGSCAAGFLIGLAFGQLILSGHLRRLAQHGWIYDLIAVDQNSYTLAYILTNIRAGDRVLMYRGFLKDFFFTKEGKISYLVLSDCARYYLALDKAARTNRPGTWRAIGAADEFSLKQWSYLVIEGEDIANVVFDRYVLNLTAEDEAQLTAALGR